MCKEEQKFIQGTEGEIKTNLISDIVINTPEFSLSGKGMTESFMLNLVRTLRGDGVAEYIGGPILHPHPTVKLDDIRLNVPTPTKDEKEDSELKSTSTKERPEYKVDIKDGIVHSVGEKITSSFGDKFADRAKELYAKAGVEHKQQDTDFYHTGIKFTQYGKPKYRCGYECPKCGAPGRHYIPFHITRVTCHQCQTTLKVEPATENGLGSSDKFRDNHGNYMFASIIDMSVDTYGKE